MLERQEKSEYSNETLALKKLDELEMALRFVESTTHGGILDEFDTLGFTSREIDMTYRQNQSKTKQIIDLEGMAISMREQIEFLSENDKDRCQRLLRKVDDFVTGYIYSESYRSSDEAAALKTLYRLETYLSQAETTSSNGIDLNVLDEDSSKTLFDQIDHLVTLLRKQIDYVDDVFKVSCNNALMRAEIFLSGHVFEDKDEEQIYLLKKKILTVDQYKEHLASIDDDDRETYNVDIESGEKKLVCIGCPHTNNIGDPIFAEIKTAFDRIQANVVLVEGLQQINRNFDDQQTEKIKHATSQEAQQKGENVYALKLSVDAGIQVESPEPSIENQLSILIDTYKFPRVQIFRFFAYNIIDQYLRSHVSPNIDECKLELHNQLKDIRRSPFFTDFNEGYMSNEELKDIQQYSRAGVEYFGQMLESKILKEELDISNPDFYAKLVDPYSSIKRRPNPRPHRSVWPDRPFKEEEFGGLINFIAESVNQIRNEHILRRIADSLKLNDKVMVIFGRSHIVMLEPALRTLMESFSDQ